jgi:hypothetical protein
MDLTKEERIARDIAAKYGTLRSELDGRALKVNEAKPREERPRGAGGGR